MQINQDGRTSQLHCGDAAVAGSRKDMCNILTRSRVSVDEDSVKGYRKRLPVEALHIYIMYVK